METILVATDFSERSDQALERAAMIAANTGAQLRFVHVVDDDQKQPIIDSQISVAQQALAEDAKRLEKAHGVKDCITDVVLGDPFEGIVKAAEASPPDLVVLGAHRRRVLRDVFVGTTAQRTIRRTRRPVLMVNAPPRTDYSRVMLCTDLSEISRASIERLVALKLGGPQSIILLHVFEALAEQMLFRSALTQAQMDQYRGELKLEAEQALTEFRAALPPIGFGTITRHYDTSISASILEASREINADLIVVTSRGRADLRKTFLGSVAEEVLRRADRDVLVIPPMAQV